MLLKIYRNRYSYQSYLFIPGALCSGYFVGTQNICRLNCQYALMCEGRTVPSKEFLCHPDQWNFAWLYVLLLQSLHTQNRGVYFDQNSQWRLKLDIAQHLQLLHVFSSSFPLLLYLWGWICERMLELLNHSCPVSRASSENAGDKSWATATAGGKV